MRGILCPEDVHHICYLCAQVSAKVAVLPSLLFALLGAVLVRYVIFACRTPSAPQTVAAIAPIVTRINAVQYDPGLTCRAFQPAQCPRNREVLDTWNSVEATATGGAMTDGVPPRGWRRRSEEWEGARSWG